MPEVDSCPMRRIKVLMEKFLKKALTFTSVCLFIFIASGLEANAGDFPVSEESVLFSGDGANILEAARRYLGTPYKYGGTNPTTGFDCSGFTGYAYNEAGLNIPRSTKDQYATLIPVRVPEPGDLVFFNINGSGVSHVGIYAGDFKFIHSPRTGKSVSFADIRNSYWKSKYVGSRSIFK